MIKPLGERVLLKPLLKGDIKEKKHEYGILLVDDDSKEKSEQGVIIAIGDKVKTRLCEGDKIVFSKYGYETIDDYYLIEEKNLLAIIK